MATTTGCLGQLGPTEQAGENFTDSGSNLDQNSLGDIDGSSTIDINTDRAKDTVNVYIAPGRTDSSGSIIGEADFSPDLTEEHNQQSEFYTIINKEVIESSKAKWAANEPANYEYKMSVKAGEDSGVLTVTCANKVCSGTGGPDGSEALAALGASYLGTILDGMVNAQEMMDAFAGIEGMDDVGMDKLSFSYRFNTTYGFVSYFKMAATEDEEEVEMEITNFTAI